MQVLNEILISHEHKALQLLRFHIQGSGARSSWAFRRRIFEGSHSGFDKIRDSSL